MSSSIEMDEASERLGAWILRVLVVWVIVCAIPWPEFVPPQTVTHAQQQAEIEARIARSPTFANLTPERAANYAVWHGPGWEAEARAQALDPLGLKKLLGIEPGRHPDGATYTKVNTVRKALLVLGLLGLAGVIALGALLTSDPRLPRRDPERFEDRYNEHRPPAHPSFDGI